MDHEANLPNDAPPTYEQALQHPRIDAVFTYAPPEYTEYDSQPPSLSYSYGGGYDGLETLPYLPTEPRRIEHREWRQGRMGATTNTVRRRSDPIVVLSDDSASMTSSTTGGGGEPGGEGCIRMALVPMSTSMAMSCLVVNILLPGIGKIQVGVR